MNCTKARMKNRIETQAGRSMLAWVVCSAIGMMFLPGCGGTREIHIKGTGEAAVEAVTDTLEAWKAGRKPDELNSDLSILARDYEWDAGATLHSFTVEKIAREDGPTWRVDAFLTFGAGGKPTTYPIQVAYSVTLHPSIAVFRLDHVE